MATASSSQLWAVTPAMRRIAAVSLADRQVRTLISDGAVTAQYADGHLVLWSAGPTAHGSALRSGARRAERCGTGAARPGQPESVRRWPLRGGGGRHGLLAAAGNATRRDRSKWTTRDARPDATRVAPPRYSPDGTQIALDVANAAGERDVWTLHRSLKTLSRVTQIGDAHDPSWLPDGRSSLS